MELLPSGSNDQLSLTPYIPSWDRFLHWSVDVKEIHDLEPWHFI